MNKDNFHDSMLGATFALARLALNQIVLLNGAGATALLAFMSSHGATRGVHCAVVLFAVGAGLGVFATVVAYLGQRANWEATKVDASAPSRRANALIVGAALIATIALTLFVVAVWRASSSL